LSVKEALCGLGEGMISIPPWPIGKLNRIQVQPSTVTLTLADRSIKKLDGMVNDAVVQEEKSSSNFVIS